MTVRILVGHVMDRLAELPDESVHQVVCSPPYYGLRDYGIEPQVWGGDQICRHEFTEHIDRTLSKRGKATGTITGSASQQLNGRFDKRSGFCRCGAWRGSLGLEPDYRLYVEHMVAVFREVRRVLRRDGTLWLNLGDCYATGAGLVDKAPGGGRQGSRWKGAGHRPAMGKHAYVDHAIGPQTQPNRMPQPGLKPKDLMLMPARVAIALQDDGWWVRRDIIWHKPAPMPESTRDRCTTAHEYLFHLSRSERYYYDADAIAEPSSPDSHARAARRRSDSHKWADGGPGDQTIARSSPSPGRSVDVTGWHQNAGGDGHAPYRHGSAPEDYDRLNSRQDVLHGKRGRGVNPKAAEAGRGTRQNASFSAAVTETVLVRNKRSVWTVPAEPFPEAHFATYPPGLIEPCILAGCPKGGTVLDPFFGAGTTGLVADRLGRNCIGIELNAAYADMARRRIERDAGMFGEVA